MSAVDALVARLGLVPHPEGGFYRETFRSADRLTLPDGRVRHASTAIHYLLPAGTFSAWHRVESDEVWHFYGGGGLLLHQLGGRTLTLNAETPQGVIPRGVWQAAEPIGDYALCGCTVAPGFDFADFEMGTRARLLAAYPAEAGVIERLTRS